MEEGPYIGDWARDAAATAEEPQSLGGPSPDLEQVSEFFNALFPNRLGQTLTFRGKPEPQDNRPAHNRHIVLNENFDAQVYDFVNWCAGEGRAAWVLPGFVTPSGTRDKDVLAFTGVMADFDKFDIDANLAAVEELIGPATIVFNSGGVTADGRQKLHAHWALFDQEPDTKAVAAVRLRLAEVFGGDKSFARIAQVTRIMGSLHLKSGPVLSARRTVRPNARYSFADIQSKIMALTPHSITKDNVVDFFDFSKVDISKRPLDELRDIYVETEAKSEVSRYDWFNRVAGAEIADAWAGRKSLEDSLKYVKGKIAGHFERPEDWDDTRVEHEFAALVRVHEKNHGKPVPPQMPAISQEANGLKLTDWYAKEKFIGAPPQRRWLIDGVIPRGTPGVFAAVGDAGKSLLALRLANVVASYPAPQTTANSPAGITDTPRFFGQPITGRGTAVFLTGEDDADEVHRRLESIDPTGSWRSPQSRLIVLPLLSAGGARAIITSGPRGPELTPAWQELRAQLEALPDLALLILDPLTMMVSGDTNDNAMGAALMGELNRLAAKTGAAIMLVHHFAKAAKISGLSDARGAVLGASAWINNGRWGLVMWEAAQDDAYGILKALGQKERAKQAGIVYFGGLTKGNAPSAKVLRTLVRDASTGILEDKTDELRNSYTPRAEVDATLHRELLALKQVKVRFSFTKSASVLMETWGGIIRKYDLPITKDGKGRGKDSVTAVFDRMLDAGLLAQTEDNGKAARYEAVERCD